MATDSSTEAQTRWEGYSDYESVSRRAAEAIDRAIDSYAKIQSLHNEGARVRAPQAAEARGNILAAALRLTPELTNDEAQYEEILDRWQTPDEVVVKDAEPADLGFIKRLDTVQLSSRCPPWLHQFVLDIRSAGWQLGYLRAGRTVNEGPDDVVERDAEALFE